MDMLTDIAAPVTPASTAGAPVANLPWEEKYRGHDLDSIILPPSIRTMVETALRLNSFGNYILYSGATGTGKTSLARAIPEMLGTESKFLYGKNNEVLAEIEEYKMYKCVDGKPRFVIIDEVDKATNAEKFFKELQSTIECATSTLRFILTCNDLWRIPAAVKSRCIPIEFSMGGCDEATLKAYKNSIYKRLMYIAKTETSAVGGACDKTTVTKTIEKFYPDIRAMIVSLHVNFLKNGGNVAGEPSGINAEIIEKLWDYVARCDVRGVRYYISTTVDDCTSVYVPFIKYAVDKVPENLLIQFAIISKNAMANARGQVDAETMLWGYLVELMHMLRQVPPKA